MTLFELVIAFVLIDLVIGAVALVLGLIYTAVRMIWEMLT